MLDIYGHKTDKPIKQAQAAANSLSALINDTTGKIVPVRPVVVFPGSYVDAVTPDANKKIWILNPKALITFLSNEKDVLSSEDQRLIAYSLSRYIRNS